ncbi:MAG: hypothetical protein IIC67_01455 [Thaumarchaeota archaeon]|nr:hypothetical protein [Nitrososphaerota archaeon]
MLHSITKSDNIPYDMLNLNTESEENFSDDDYDDDFPDDDFLDDDGDDVNNGNSNNDSENEDIGRGIIHHLCMNKVVVV